MLGGSSTGSVGPVSPGAGSVVPVAGSVLSPGRGSSDEPAEGSAAVGSSVVSRAYAAGAAPEALPGSTVSSRRPAGSPADVPSPADTRTSTPSDGPTQRGSVLPRTPGRPASVRPSTSVSRGSHADQSPEEADRVRASTVPVTSADGSVQVTPSMLNGPDSRCRRDAVSPSADTSSAVRRTSARAGADLASGPASAPDVTVPPSSTRTPATAAVATAAVAHVLRFTRTWDPRGCRLPLRQLERFSRVRPTPSHDRRRSSAFRPRYPDSS
ncbi:hypothetical protein EES45_10655 [Streptomyces sp. ADI97-07]|nr:hypothetical protein EES45_10655 [Streptomyces sp. ADI97-07]